MSDELWLSRPWVVRHSHHGGKDRFQRDESAFENWVAVILEEGKFAFEVEGERGTARFGDILVCRPGVSFWRHALRRISYHVLTWEWPGVPHGASGAGGRRGVRDTKRLVANCAALHPLLGREDNWSLARKSVLLHEILLLGVEPAPRDATDAPMQEAARRLREECGSRLRMREVSDALALSPVAFTRRFQAATGQSPTEFLTQARLQRARELLLDTDLTIQSVAEKCGYESGLYLSRVFSQRVGLSPGAFRKANRV